MFLCLYGDARLADHGAGGAELSTPTTSRKFGETDRAGNRTEEASQVEDWLGKYLIKQRDERTLLVYPRTDDDNNNNNSDNNKRGGSGESEVR